MKCKITCLSTIVAGIASLGVFGISTPAKSQLSEKVNHLVRAVDKSWISLEEARKWSDRQNLLNRTGAVYSLYRNGIIKYKEASAILLSQGRINPNETVPLTPPNQGQYYVEQKNQPPMARRIPPYRRDKIQCGPERKDAAIESVKTWQKKQNAERARLGSFAFKQSSPYGLAIDTASLVAQIIDATTRFKKDTKYWTYWIATEAYHRHAKSDECQWNFNLEWNEFTNWWEKHPVVRDIAPWRFFYIKSKSESSSDSQNNNSGSQNNSENNVDLCNDGVCIK